MWCIKETEAQGALINSHKVIDISVEDSKKKKTVTSRLCHFSLFSNLLLSDLFPLTMRNIFPDSDSNLKCSYTPPCKEVSSWYGKPRYSVKIAYNSDYMQVCIYVMNMETAMQWYMYICISISLYVYMCIVYICNITTPKTNRILENLGFFLTFAAWTKGKGCMSLLACHHSFGAGKFLVPECKKCMVREEHAHGCTTHVLPPSPIPACWEWLSHALAFQLYLQYYSNIYTPLAIGRTIACLYQQWEVYIKCRALLVQKQWAAIAHDIC